MSGYRLTVLGDSFSAGWGDPTPEGGYYGWVRRFSSLTGIRPGRVHNLARFGATTSQVVNSQLPLAAAGEAPLVVAIVGVNDLLAERPGYDAQSFRHNLRTLFDALTGPETTVVTAKYPDVPANLEVSEFTRRSLRRRFGEANDALTEVAAQTGVCCIDLTRQPVWRNATMWDADRLHPGPVLHQHFAEQIANLVECDGLLVAA